MNFLGIGTVEILLIIILSFLVLEPDRMPQIARTMGRIMHQIKQASTEFINNLTKETKEVEEVKKELADSVKEDITTPD